MSEKEKIIGLIKNTLLRIKEEEDGCNEGSLTDCDIEYIFLLLDRLEKLR